MRYAPSDFRTPLRPAWSLPAAALLAAAAAEGASAEPAAARSAGGSFGSTFLKLGQRGSVGGVAVTALRVEEDSRCPMHAQCIQAGTVRLSVRIGTSARVLTWAKPFGLGSGAWLTLCDVIPYPHRTGRIGPGDYRFGFVLLRGAVPPARGRACPTPVAESAG
jgi:hypothetical protein